MVLCPVAGRFIQKSGSIGESCGAAKSIVGVTADYMRCSLFFARAARRHVARQPAKLDWMAAGSSI